MSIFATNKNERELKTEKLIKRLTISPEAYTRAIGERLLSYTKNPETLVIKPIELCADCIEMIVENRENYEPKDYNEVFMKGQRIYKEIFPFDEATPDFEKLEMVFLEMFDVNGVISRNCFNITLFNLFTDKFNFLKWADSTGYYNNVSELGSAFIPYVTAARGYYADEDMFTANIISVFLKMQASPDIMAVYHEELSKLEHMAGIYRVDEARILKAEQKLDTADALIAKSNHILGVVDDRVKMIDDVTKQSFDKVKQYCEAEISSAKVELGAIDQEMQKRLDDYVEAQKRVILFEKTEFVNQMFAEAENKLAEMKSMAKMVVNSANLELVRINQESGNVIAKLDDYINDDERVQQLLSDANENKKLMTKIDKLMLLNDKNIDRISETMEGQVQIAMQAVAAPTTAAAPQVQVVSGNPDMTVAVTDDVVDEVIKGPNVFLDESVNFKERFDRIMERKARRMEAGEHFHCMFDDVLVAVMENANPYLTGPTGCGKTFLVSQIASLLDMEYIDIGYINEEYDILGFQTANGGYSKPNFYRCYKYGKIAFCDELDNGNARATVKLNSFLSNTSNVSYCFPNGENVPRHPSFRMIAAGNTIGNGADNNYNTREKIEESVQQRLMPIFVGYDNEVEKKILGGYDDWFEFVSLFRRATDEWSKDNYGDASGIITTRDVARIKRYLDNSSLSPEKIIDYQFIQTKDNNYLAFLNSFMASHTAPGSKAAPFVQMFANKVNILRNSRK